jgi:hypothetical protein
VWVTISISPKKSWSEKKRDIPVQPIPAYMRLRISIRMPNFRMPNFDSVNLCHVCGDRLYIQVYLFFDKYIPVHLL